MRVLWMFLLCAGCAQAVSTSSEESPFARQPGLNHSESTGSESTSSSEESSSSGDAVAKDLPSEQTSDEESSSSGGESSGSVEGTTSGSSSSGSSTGDTSSSSSSSTEGSEESSSEGSSSGGPADQPTAGLFEACLENSVCDQGLGCVLIFDENMQDPVDGFCSRTCTKDDECGPLAGASCKLRPDMLGKACVLDCSQDETLCPNQMVCQFVAGFDKICV